MPASIRAAQRGRLTRSRCARLVRAVRAALKAAIRAGGTTLRDYVGTDGNPGCFRQKLYVYERDGKPLPRLRYPDPQDHPGSALDLLLSAAASADATSICSPRRAHRVLQSRSGDGRR